MKKCKPGDCLSEVFGRVVFGAELHRAQTDIVSTSAIQDTRERHQVDGDLAQVTVQPYSPATRRNAGGFSKQGYRCKAQPLSREAQAAGHAAHGRRDQVVQVTVGWRRQLPRQPVRRCSFGPPGRLCPLLFRPLQVFNFLHTYPETGGMTCAQLANPNKEADVDCGFCFAPTKQGSPIDGA